MAYINKILFFTHATYPLQVCWEPCSLPTHSRTWANGAATILNVDSPYSRKRNIAFMFGLLAPLPRHTTRHLYPCFIVQIKLIWSVLSSTEEHCIPFRERHCRKRKWNIWWTVIQCSAGGITVVQRRDDGSFEGRSVSKGRDKCTDLRLFLELLFGCDDGLNMIFVCLFCSVTLIRQGKP